VTALSNMAAATRPPGLGDARVPCPLCGGLIHPVAGRCKHCKEDLSALRAGRPQAATPLPSLAGATPAVLHAAAAAPAAYAAPQTAAAIPVTIPTAREGSQPILPQRPTSQWRMKAQRAGGLAKHWPLIVIVLAVLAILAAIAIMMWPEDEAKTGKRRLSAPPAPDRMNTDPLGKQGQADPWGNPDDYQPADPQGQPGTVPHVTPDPPRQPAQPDPDDLFGGLGGGGPGASLGGGQLTGTFMLTMMHQACKKLQTCPSSDQATLSAVCSQFNSMPRPPVPANCPPAQRCLDAIDALDCDAGIDNPVSALALIQDCKEAFTEC
jgi:hypothetical protein